MVDRLETGLVVVDRLDVEQEIRADSGLAVADWQTVGQVARSGFGRDSVFSWLTADVNEDRCW